MMLRKKVAEAGVNYNELSGIYKAQKEDAKEVTFYVFCLESLSCLVLYK